VLEEKFSMGQVLCIEWLPFRTGWLVVENKSPAGTMSTAKFGETMLDVKNM